MNRNTLPSFAQRMEAARARKPASGGTTYRRLFAKQADQSAAMPKGSHERFCYEIASSCKYEIGNALEDFRRILYPERYEEIL